MIDHPDLFHSPDISARSPQETDYFTDTAPSTPLISYQTLTQSVPVPRLKGPQDRSPDVSSTTVGPHTQPVEQQESWASSAFVAPPLQSQSRDQSNYSAYSNNQSTTVVPPLTRVPPPGATIIEPVASYTFNGNAYVDDATYQTHAHQRPIPNYYQQELNQQQYQTAYMQPMYQDPCRQQQQGYQEASSLPYSQQQQYHHQEYPEPELVDTIEKVNYTKDQDSSLKKASTPTGKRKRLYWIGGILITILAGVLVGLILSMNNKDSSNNNRSSNNSSSSENGTEATGSNTSSSSSTWSAGGGGGSNPTGTPVGTTLSNAVEPTGGSVVAPPPMTTSSGEQPPVVNSPVQPTLPPQTNPPPEEKTTTTTTTTTEPPKPTSGDGNFGPRVPTPPLPSLPPKGQCSALWCDDKYLWWCLNDICVNDGELKACKAGCTNQFCQMACETKNECRQGCIANNNACNNHCKP